MTLEEAVKELITNDIRWAIEEIENNEEDAEDLSEDDVFDFYSYRGKVFVGYNGYADGSFSSYPLKFQEKALELIKQRI